MTCVEVRALLPCSACSAVSTTSDPSGTYNRYSYSFGTNLNDYGKLGNAQPQLLQLQLPHCLASTGVFGANWVMSFNIFANATTYFGAQGQITGAANHTHHSCQCARSIGPPC